MLYMCMCEKSCILKVILRHWRRAYSEGVCIQSMYYINVPGSNISILRIQCLNVITNAVTINFKKVSFFKTIFKCVIKMLLAKVAL